MNHTPKPSGWRAVFPHPVLSMQLGISWLVLAHSLALVHWLSALLLAWGVPRLLHPFLGPAVRLHWPSLLRLMAVVLWDIVVSNITVARITLGSMKTPRPAWLRVPLATQDARLNAILASIVTTTPGTVSMVLDESRQELLVHALNCDDADAMIADIKARYETPLIQVFRLKEHA
jgi:multicomponent K+:H+ antiporter subunit E